LKWPFDLKKDGHMSDPSDHSKDTKVHTTRKLLTYAASGGTYHSVKKGGAIVLFKTSMNKELNLLYMKIDVCNYAKNIDAKTACMCAYHNKFYAEAQQQQAQAGVQPQQQPDVQRELPRQEAAAAPAHVVGAGHRKFADLLPKQWQVVLGPSAEYVGKTLYTMSSRKRLERKRNTTQVHHASPPPPPWQSLKGLRDPVMYFLHDFILIAPMMQHGVRLCCPTCKRGGAVQMAMAANAGQGQPAAHTGEGEPVAQERADAEDEQLPPLEEDEDDLVGGELEDERDADEAQLAQLHVEPEGS
jgi:hypothetical protein